MNGYIQKFMPLWKNSELSDFLGQGSYGEVWKLIYKQEDRIIREDAVKEILIPPASMGSLKAAKLQGLDIEGAKIYFDKVLEATQAEVDMMHSLSECPNIVQFYDYQIKNLSVVGEYGWSLYIRMEILQDLSSFLLDGGITYYEIARLGIDISNALETCQKHNLVHRDIKPDNLFYDSHKKCFKLGDFGVSHYLDRPTEGKGRAGTLTYMPPEVYDGAPFNFSSDQYALGMILYKLLNDNRIPGLPEYPKPFSPKERDRALVARLHGAEVIMPSSYNRSDQIQSPTIRVDESISIRDSLCEIATKAVAKCPANRYANITEFKRTLERLI